MGYILIMEEREQLLKELRKLIKEIPEEGLIFLIEQANKMIYNKKLSELNSMQKRISRKKSESSPGKPAGLPFQEEEAISVERGSFNRGFILSIGKTRKSLTEEEMTSLVKASHKAPDTESAPDRIYSYLKKERDDILLDAGIRDQKDPRLPEIHRYLKKTFSLSE